MTTKVVKIFFTFYLLIQTLLADDYEYVLSEPGTTLLQSTDSLRRNMAKVMLQEDDEDVAPQAKPVEAAVEQGASMIQRAGVNLLSGGGSMIEEELDSAPCMNPNVEPNDHIGEHRSVGMRSCFYETDCGF